MVVFGLILFLFEGMWKFFGGFEVVGVWRFVIRVIFISGNYWFYDLDYLSDVFVCVKKYDKVGFDYVGDFLKGVKIWFLNYEYESVFGGYFINLKIFEVSVDFVSVFRDVLIEVLVEQFVDVVCQVKLDIVLVDKMVVDSLSLGGDFLVQRVFIFYCFLILLGVVDGIMCFIEIGEFYSFVLQKVSVMKIWIIGVLSGIVVVCFYVVV